MAMTEEENAIMRTLLKVIITCQSFTLIGLIYLMTGCSGAAPDQALSPSPNTAADEGGATEPPPVFTRTYRGNGSE
jgi:hypothetical protein